MVKQQVTNTNKMAPVKSWIYITFIKKNLFIHVYNEVDGKKVAVKFLSLSTFIPKSNLKTKIDPNRVELFADFIAEWLKKWNAHELVVVFRGRGTRINIRLPDPISEIDRKRAIFISAFEVAQVAVTSLIELSPIPYNGCKTSRKRRGRNKYIRTFFEKT